MASPFPGMNPYLEDPAFWPDFHATFIGCWRDPLRSALPKGYEARIGERFLPMLPPDDDRQIERDVVVSRATPPCSPCRKASGAAVVLEPVTLPLVMLDETREAYIEIRQRSDRSLVAVLELLSPWNKREPGFGDYLGRRQAVLRQDVHLVELGLLRGGSRLPVRGTLPAGDFYAFVSRSDRRPDCDVFHWGLRDPLPVIPIPLRAPDGEAGVDLATAFADALEQGFYDDSPDFGRRLPVQLSDDDAAWVAERMRLSANP